MIKNNNTVVKLVYGSYLYGTNTENSDRDYKGVYLPSIEECILGTVSKSVRDNTKLDSCAKNTVNDVDYEMYSLQYFILTLGKNGDTTFLDMIHAPDNALIMSSDYWKFIKENRSKFYTKNLSAYLGYCRNQANKYGIKGSRLAEAERILNILEEYSENERLEFAYSKITESDYVKKTHIVSEPALEVCDKVFSVKTKINLIKESLSKFVLRYGDRAAYAKDNKGIDWKAISHAFRVGVQMEELYTEGTITFPLKDSRFLTDVKLGKYHYANDCIGERLSELIDRVESYAKNSKYPEAIDINFWEIWVTSLYKS